MGIISKIFNKKKATVFDVVPKQGIGPVKIGMSVDDVKDIMLQFPGAEEDFQSDGFYDPKVKGRLIYGAVGVDSGRESSSNTLVETY